MWVKSRLFCFVTKAVVGQIICRSRPCDGCSWMFNNLSFTVCDCNNHWLSSGDFSWSTSAEETPGVTPALVLPTAAPVLPSGFDDDEEGVEDMDEDIQATVARLSETFTALRSVLTPLFFRGFFAFLTWWVAACQVISSLFGIYFHQYLMQNWGKQSAQLLYRQCNADRGGDISLRHNYWQILPCFLLKHVKVRHCLLQYWPLCWFKVCDQQSTVTNITNIQTLYTVACITSALSLWASY